MSNKVIILICAALLITGLILPIAFGVSVGENQYTNEFYIAYPLRPVLGASVPFGVAALLFSLWFGLRGGSLGAAIEPILAGVSLSLSGVFYGCCYMNWRAGFVLDQFMENWGSLTGIPAGMSNASYQYGNSAKIYAVALFVSLAVFIFFAYRSLRVKTVKKKAPVVSQDDLFSDMF